jgi:hypothetical protein
MHLVWREGLLAASAGYRPTAADVMMLMDDRASRRRQHAEVLEALAAVAMASRRAR